MITKDIVVVGAGLAGLRAAITAAQSGQSVLLLAKDRLCTGSSFYPMMDMVACQSAFETPEEDAVFLEELLDTSLGMASESMYRRYITEIPQAVREMEQLGISPKLTDPKPACFAKTARPTYAWSGWQEIRAKARDTLSSLSNVELREQTQALCLITRNGRIRAIELLGAHGRQTVACKSVILASGGFGDLYQHSLNTPDVSGDGHALALWAGADLVNLEFLQFIPGFVSPAYKTVFREPTLRYAQRMRGEDGQDLLARYLPLEEERRECLALRACHGPFTSRTKAKWFDIAMMEQVLMQKPLRGLPIRYEPEMLESTFTFIAPYVKWLRESLKVDIIHDEIRIAPFYHAANGGVRVGEDCETRVAGLFACGEVSGGIHGADRQGGMSTGSCLVFGKVAAQAAVKYANGTALELPGSAEAGEALARMYGQGKKTSGLHAEDILPLLRELMWRNTNILRSDSALAAAQNQLHSWEEDFAFVDFSANRQAVKQSVKARQFLSLSQALILAMRARKESRGAHYRSDYPDMNPAYGFRYVVDLCHSGEEGMRVLPEKDLEKS